MIAGVGVWGCGGREKEGCVAELMPGMGFPLAEWKGTERERVRGHLLCAVGEDSGKA